MYLRGTAIVRVLLLWIALFVVVFDGGGPKSLGDELIVRTSRFFADPKKMNERPNALV
jgi:hypothetical protein